MKEVNLLRESGNDQIKINGHVFTILVSDDEVFDLYRELAEKVQGMTANELETVTDAVDYINGLFPRILGEGALEKISGGVPVGIADKTKWIHTILLSLVEVYTEALADKYA